MAKAECESAESKWSGRMSDGKHYEAEAPCWPRHVGLDTPGETRAIAAFGFTTLQSREGEAAIAVYFAAEYFECVTCDPRMVREVFGNRVLIEDDRD